MIKLPMNLYKKERWMDLIYKYVNKYYTSEVANFFKQLSYTWNLNLIGL